MTPRPFPLSVRLLTLLSPLLAACGSPSYYPDMNRYLGRFETGLWDSADSGDPVGDAPCPTLTEQAVEIRVVETSAAALTLHQKAVDCTESYQGPLVDGQMYTLGTVAGAVFLVRTASGELYGWTVVPGGAATYHWDIP